MRQADLDAVREASRREREHASAYRSGWCCCQYCEHDRMTIARHAPALLRYIDDDVAQPRCAHHDLGDLD